jgi:NitT/TauT family transport system substrate-binding protein
VNYFVSWTGAWDSVVMKEKGLWQKYLPPGSTVTWTRNIAGAPVANDLVAGKLDIGYIGDMPGLVATSKRDQGDVRIVAVNAKSPGRLCGNLLVRSDAPQFNSLSEIARWMNGKIAGQLRGSCGDRMMQAIARKENVNLQFEYPGAEVAMTQLRAKKIDLVLQFEPHASKAVHEGYARRVATAGAWGLTDANVVLMRKEFIDANREAAIGWLKANIEALEFMRDNPEEVARIVAANLEGYDEKTLLRALLELPPMTTDKTVFIAQMAIDQPTEEFLLDAYRFLYEIKAVNTEQPLEGALYKELVEQALKEMGKSAPLFTIEGRPESAFN